MPKKTKNAVRPRVKLWLEKDDEYVFGFGLSNILKAVDQTGSIKKAAASLGKSYRHVWARVKSAESALGIPLVETRVGGEGTHRSQLTQQAKLLVKEFDDVRRDVIELVEQRFSARLMQVARSMLEPPGR